MPHICKTVFIIGFLGLITGCTQPAENEFVVADPDRISTEPAPGGKY